MTRSAISVISNFAFTGSRTSTSSPRLRRSFTNSCRLFTGTAHLPRRGLDALLRALLVFAGDYAEELREVRRPQRDGDRAPARDLTRAVPDHAARHPDEARLVEPRYGLDRQSVRVVSDQDRIVSRRPAVVVCPEPFLQVPQSLGDDPSTRVPSGRSRQSSRGTQEDTPQRVLRCTPPRVHLAPPRARRRQREPLPGRLEGPFQILFGVDGGDEAGLVLARGEVDAAPQHVPEEVLERLRIRAGRRVEVRHRPFGKEDAHHRAELVYSDGYVSLARDLAHPPPPALSQHFEPLVEARLARGSQGSQARRHRQRVAREGAGLVDGTGGGDLLHDLSPPAERPDRQPAPYDLAETRHVRDNPITLLSPAVGEPEAGHHLVED